MIRCRDCGKELKPKFEGDVPVWCSECDRKHADVFNRQSAEFAREQDAKLAFQVWHDEISE